MQEDRPYIYPLGKDDKSAPLSQSAIVDKVSSAPESVGQPNTFAKKELDNTVASATPREGYKADAPGFVPQNEIDTPDVDSYRKSDGVATGYLRFSPVSGGIFYDVGTDFSVRRLIGSDIAALATAGQADSTTLLLDAINPTLNGFDVRFMTAGDFKHLLYYHRLVSFPKRPWIRRFTSKYGNDNEITVKEMGEIKFKTPRITQAEYQNEFVAKGLCVPLMRDVEYLEIFSPKAIADKYIYMQAQYFQGATFAEKLAKHKAADGELIGLSVTLKEISEHGVVEEIECVDAKFDPKAWVDELKARHRILKAALVDYIKLDYDVKAMETQEIILDIEDEIASIETDLAEGKEVRPDKETILVPLSAATFLSGL